MPSKGIELMQQIWKPSQNKKTLNYKRLHTCYPKLVNLTTTQVETLFGELEYIESRLQTLGLSA
jgi:hypothetical protein